MTDVIVKKIQQQINDNSIIIYIKGTPENPECGFSARALQTLSIYSKEFTYINVLNDQDIRHTLPKFSSWPTFPQLWINGEFIGGCDIIVDMHHSGELKQLITSVEHKK